MALMRYEVLEISKLITNNSLCNILMMGVQGVLTSLKDIEHDFVEFDIDYDKIVFKQLYEKSKVNAVDVFRTLNCVKIVDCMDYSNYEGADIICNLNEKIIKNLKYDLVIDGGTLEHVYNVSNAISNMNYFVKVGGYIYHMVPCSGWVNHGFYSFSPTFFIDSYNNYSGFNLIECNMCFKQPKGQKDRLLFSSDCRLINDKEMNQLIIENSTSGGVFIKCVAKKVIYKNWGEYIPQQSMYKNSLWIENIDENELVKKAVQVVRKYSSGIFLYGIGMLFNMIVDELIKNDLYDLVDGLFDSDIKKVDGIYRNKKIYYPTNLNLKKAKCIIITTYKYEDEIYEMLQKKNDCKYVIERLTKNS